MGCLRAVPRAVACPSRVAPLWLVLVTILPPTRGPSLVVGREAVVVGKRRANNPVGFPRAALQAPTTFSGVSRPLRACVTLMTPPSHRDCLTRSVCVVWWRGGSFRRQRQATAQRAKPWLHLASFPLFRVSWIRATRAFQKLPFLASYRSCWQRLILIGLTPGFRASALKPGVVSQRAFTDALKLDLIFRF